MLRLFLNGCASVSPSATVPCEAALNWESLCWIILSSVNLSLRLVFKYCVTLGERPHTLQHRLPGSWNSMHGSFRCVSSRLLVGPSHSYSTPCCHSLKALEAFNKRTVWVGHCWPRQLLLHASNTDLLSSWPRLFRHGFDVTRDAGEYTCCCKKTHITAKVCAVNV